MGISTAPPPDNTRPMRGRPCTSAVTALASAADVSVAIAAFTCSSPSASAAHANLPTNREITLFWFKRCMVTWKTPASDGFKQ
ncbi:hypothetical protein CAter10_2218 [Collimonas arenae]|nr:hypothetical protein CAter10_2218 [Collimonas arenae]